MNYKIFDRLIILIITYYRNTHIIEARELIILSTKILINLKTISLNFILVRRHFQKNIH